MLFALWDYANYRRKKSRYADANLESLGAIRASRANFPIESSFVPGALIVFHIRNSVPSWAVMYYTNSVWSHLAVMVKNDEVIHATLAGVVRQSFYDLCDDDSYVRVLYPRDKEMGIQAASRAMLLEGFPYGWSKTIGTFLLIILGINRYRLSIFLDFVILVLPVAAIGLWMPIFFWIPVATLAQYGTVVLFNILKRRIFGSDAEGDEREQLVEPV